MKTPSDIRSFVRRQRGPMLNALREWVGINTWTRHKAGNDRLQKALRRLMPPGYALDVVRQAEFGDHYRYVYAGPPIRPIALHGHVDTLCPYEASFHSLTARGGRLCGPGVHDMKAGLVTLVWSLKTLAHLGRLGDLPLVVLFNTDEEIGSVTSRPLFKDLAARGVRLALKFECAAPGNTLVTTRKGIARFVLTARGQAAHFGNLKTRKLSAVAEIGRKIGLIEALNQPDGRIAANVGRVVGGLASNIVADQAVMDFELRFWDRALMDRTLAALPARVLAPGTPGIRLALEETARIGPWRPDAASRRLFALACDIGRAMGQPLLEEHRGGISDSNRVSAVGIPALDGFGPVGDGDCTRSEYIRATSLPARVELTTRLLLYLADHPRAP